MNGSTYTNLHGPAKLLFLGCENVSGQFRADVVGKDLTDSGLLLLQFQRGRDEADLPGLQDGVPLGPHHRGGLPRHLLQVLPSER